MQKQDRTYIIDPSFGRAISINTPIQQIPPMCVVALNRAVTQYLFNSKFRENDISTQPLTLKEIDILKYLNEGHNNKEISEKLFISLNTVKSHIKNIYKKVNVNNRLHLKEKTYLLNI